MKPSVQYCLLNASSIDLEDRTYFLSPESEPPSPHLIDSIREFGILMPPLMLQMRRDRHIPVTGWKRLTTVIDILHWEQIPCLAIPPETTDTDIYALLLEQSLLGPPLSLAEQSSYFMKLARTCPGTDGLLLLAKLGYKPTRHQLDELLALQKLTTSATLALHRGILTPAGARRLLPLPPADQTTLAELIAKFQLGSSKQLKLIESCNELQRRQGGSIEEILRPFLEKAEKFRQENHPQQASALLGWLHGQCFPRSTLAEQEFSRRVAQLNLPSDMAIAHSPSFEEDSVALNLKFADWDSLVRVLPKIRTLLDR